MRNLGQNKTMLDGCGHYQVCAQLDGERTTRGSGVQQDDGTLKKIGRGLFLPQHFLLEQLHREHRNAMYVLPLRDAEVWAGSVVRWFNLKGMFANEYFNNNATTHKTSTKAHIMMPWLMKIYNEHTEYVRQFVKDNPEHTLVEVDITDPNAGQIMGDAFGLDAGCWGHHNKADDHSKLNSKGRA